MSEEKKNTAVTKKETLTALRNPGELYVIMSGATKQPFVVCDPVTFDDEVLLFYRSENAKSEAEHLAEQRYRTVVAKIEEKQLLAFYSSLYPKGVNCLMVNRGTDTEISVQLAELVTRPTADKLPEGKKLIENPALYLTAMYFMQEMRRQEKPELTDELKELQEELLAHYRDGVFLFGMEEDNKVPVLKQKNGMIYQPVFTDVIEFQKFNREKKLKPMVVKAEKIPEILAPEVKGVVINPLGVNVQLQVARRNSSPAEQQTGPEQ